MSRESNRGSRRPEGHPEKNLNAEKKKGEIGLTFPMLINISNGESKAQGLAISLAFSLSLSSTPPTPSSPRPRC